ncbi:MAG TPA: zinc ribbon domain-containing protein [archaeon]|nr:zinc ribbon domain-containing protein [archaeon]
MRCTNCKREIPQAHYCPHCGEHQPHGGGDHQGFDALFNDRFFADIMESFQRMFADMGLDESFEKEVIDLTKAGKRRRGAGFTINIVQSGEGPPQIRIQPLGEAMEPSAQQELPRRAVAKPLPKKFTEAKQSEEPESVVRRVGEALIADLEVPGVRSEDDIAVTELENSVEVRALAGEKAFFKIITKPAKLRLVGKKFKNGKLHLEFS